jgi:hypothetical protein
MSLAAKLLRLDWRDRGLVLAAARTLAVTWVALRTAGFSSVRSKSALVAGQSSRPHAWCGPPPKWSISRPTVDRVSWAVRAVSRFVPGASNCLVRALATQALLGKYGYQSELRIGVRKDADASLAAHAWLESGGAIVIGEFELDQYVPLAPPRTTSSGSAA